MADTITVACPNCSREMRASAQHVGRRGKCPGCGQIVTIAPSGSDSSVALSFATGAGTRAGRPADPAPSGTEVNHLLAGLIGLAAAALLYAVFYALPKDYTLYKFMTQRSGVQHIITLVTCWGLAFLALKYVAVQRELRSADRELELIPLEIGLQITPANVDKFIDHLGRLPADERDGFLARRIRGALDHFKHRNNVSEVQGYLATQAEIEASAVDSGYTLMRVFIWVCPILGFIGTVLGISFAVTELAAALPKPGEAGTELGGKLMAGIGKVTGGLATAFDTTMLGLVCVVILMFPTEALKKIEYGMLDRVQAFANESLLRRMAEGQPQGEDAAMPKVVRQALESAFQEHQRWLTQWQAQVAKLGQVIGGEFEAYATGVQNRVAQGSAAQAAAVEGAARRVADAIGQFDRAAGAFERAAGADVKETLAAMARLHESLAGNTAALGRVLGQQEELAARYSAADLDGALRALAEAVTKLADDRGPEIVSEVEAEVETERPNPTVENTLLSDGPPAGPRPGLFGRIFGRNGH